MAYRLAIAISGAVSLGSYEAGVMFEIIRAIGSHNSNVEDPDEQIKIDVLTGASAGGMTAAILAQKLLFDAGALDDPYENHLYQPWVQMADVEGMLETHEGDDPNKSILSSGFIAKIADRFLLDRYSNSNVLPPVRHAASADTIRLGLAMSNLNGVDYRIPVFDGAELSDPNSDFTFTRFQDRMTLEVGAGNDEPEFWQKIGAAARSCGAFPFAFRALQVDRQKDEADYNDPNLNWNDAIESPFIYTDGGVFNNSPLGMAKRLADYHDINPRDYEKRFYLYISPDRKVSTVNLSIRESNATMLNTGKALLNSIFQQGRFQDWIQTAHYNEIIQQFDDRAYRLRELLRRSDEADRNATNDVAENLLTHLYVQMNNKVPSREDDFARLKDQFMADAEAQTLLTEKGAQAIDVWIKAVQVLEKSSRLGQKDTMQVYTITAGDDELAGEGMAAFAGFFDLDFRKFDYNTGRKKARSFLNNLRDQIRQTSNDNYMPLTEFQFKEDIQDTAKDLANATLADVDREVREKLSARFYDRTERLLKQFGVNILIRKPLMWFIVGNKIRAFLKLN